MFIAVRYASVRQEPFNPRVSAMILYIERVKNLECGCNLHLHGSVYHFIFGIYDI